MVVSVDPLPLFLTVSPEEELQKQPSHENKLHMRTMDTPDTLRDVCQHNAPLVLLKVLASRLLVINYMYSKAFRNY
jgi:hypothetical protein